MPAAPMQPWLNHYPPGVPATVDASAYPSLVALLDEAWHRHASRDASACMGSRLRFRDVDELSHALAAWLQAQGLAKGERVAIMMPNLPQYMVAIGAILRAGCVVVNVNPLYTARELAHQLKDSGAHAIIVLENFAHTLEDAIGQTDVRHVVLASMGDLLGFWKGQFVNFAVRHLKKMVPEFRLPLDTGHTVTRFNMAVAEGSRLPLKPVALGPDDVAFLQYTGGTTGVSKGATLTHRNVVANILQTEAWFKPMFERLGDKPLTVVCALPLYHIFALTICYMFGARLGALNLLIPNPRDLPGLVRTLSEYKVNMFPAVNTLFNALANDASFARLDFSDLVVSNGKATACPKPRRWPPATASTRDFTGRSAARSRRPRSPSATTTAPMSSDRRAG
jgi:long-chain acyl-CoA synthetase